VEDVYSVNWHSKENYDDEIHEIWLSPNYDERTVQLVWAKSFGT